MLLTFFPLVLFIVVETKDGAISVASAFSGYQEGNFKVISYLISFHPQNEILELSVYAADHMLFWWFSQLISLLFSFSRII